MPILPAIFWSLPWIVAPLVTYIRLRHSRSLDDESDSPPAAPPRVSVIVPARNEARNIARCVTSILSTSYPNIELIFGHDASTDQTREIAERAIGEDRRARVIANPPLPAGWFGKHWACSTGGKVARGQILPFTGADPEHAPDLVTRSINAMQRTRADLFSVAGHQELGGFWEKLIQPQMFTVLSMRYGGSESITQSNRVSNKIANGQCIFVDRNSYESIGGHASVRSAVAEDLLLAQRFFAARKHVVVMVGVKQLSTRMYESLGEIISGWRKNVFAGGLDAVPFGKIGQSLLPLALLLPPLLELLPPLALLLALFGAPAGGEGILWAAISCGATLFWRSEERRGGKEG